MATRKPPTPEALAAALRLAERAYGHRENFTGADIGYRWQGGHPTDEVVVRVHVRRKIPLGDLSAEAVLPDEIGGVPLDVIEGDYRPQPASAPAAAHRRRYPFVIGGGSIGRPDNGGGTLGLLVIDRAGRWPGILSNWHVLAGPRAQPGDPIEQPARADQGSGGPAGPVARLDRWMLDHDGDAAVARLDSGQIWIPLQLGVFAELRQARRARLGDVLVKSGRTTGVTRARVDGLGLYRVGFEVRPGIVEGRDITGFKLVPEAAGNPDNIEISAPGDSGSIWFHEGERAGVGLHFAGETRPEPEAEHAIACHLDRVLDRLDLDIASFEDLQAHRAGESGRELTPVPPDAPWPCWPPSLWPPAPAWPPAPWPPTPWPPTSWPPTSWPPAPWRPAPGSPMQPHPWWQGGAAPGNLWARGTGPAHEGPGAPAPVSAAQGAPARPDHRFDRQEIIFRVLTDALARYFGARPLINATDPVSALLVGPGDPYPVLAQAINLHPRFRALWSTGAGLPRPVAQRDLFACVTYLQVCAVLDDIIERKIP